MPDHVIQRVEQLGRRDNQPTLLTFTDKQGTELLDEATPDIDLTANDLDSDLSMDATMDEHITGVDQAAVPEHIDNDTLQ